MISENGSIVFFESRNLGQCLHCPYNNSKIGRIYNDWSMESFGDFDGKITLEND